MESAEIKSELEDDGPEKSNPITQDDGPGSNPILEETNPEKLYDIQRLRQFGEVPFLIKRMEPQDSVVSYSAAMEILEEVLEFLRRHHIPRGAGIALRITQHTKASCLLILA